MILQLGGMGNLVLGITTMESDNFVNEANKEGKYDF